MKRATSNKDRGAHDPQSSEAKAVKATHSAEHTAHAQADPNTATARKARAPAAADAAKPAAPQSAKLGGVKHPAGMDSPKASKAPSVLSPPSQPSKPHDSGHQPPSKASGLQSGSSPRGSSPADEDPRFQDL